MYIGIDPGKLGGIAVLYKETKANAFRYTPEKLIEICEEIVSSNTTSHVFVEKVHAMPHQGVSSMFTFGAGYGEIQGILKAFHLKYELVLPHVWKKEIGVNSDKRTSIRKAKELFPHVSLLPTSRCRTDDDGLAESLLIAEYARRHYENFV